MHGSRVQVDCSRARSNYQVVKMAVDHLGWMITENITGENEIDDEGASQIYWLAAPEPDVYAQVSECRINKFPGMQEITKKVSLTRSLNALQRLFPEEFRFYPRSWFMPGQYQEFREHCSAKKRQCEEKTWYIVKPDNGTQGDGIYLISEPDQLRNVEQPELIQEYVSDPYLFKDSLKFDLRVYVLVKSINPLNILICKEGMVRFATEKYRPPSKGNYKRSNMHLTNFSLNRSHPNYIFGQNHKDFIGSKRLLSTLFSELRASGIDTDRLWRDICLIAVRTIIALIPDMIIRYEKEYYARDQKVECFQIVGFDILLTQGLEVVLLEVNASPSLNICVDKENDLISNIDKEIKYQVVYDTLKLIGQDMQKQGILKDSDSSSVTSLTPIFPDLFGEKVGHTIMLHRAAYLFLQFINARRRLCMTIAGFRQFLRKCSLITENELTFSEADTLYINVLRQWHGYFSSGIPFNGFVDLLLIMARLKYPTISISADALRQLLHHCEHVLTHHGVSSSRLRPDRETVQTAAEHGRRKDLGRIYLLPHRVLAKSRKRAKTT